ncbi:MAG: hypothetical protein FRX49_04069 [Trebouxia sp. A1-2]|nr:MAG: hypothetical protein FRX49_04069 [Trebouxia sp. A1-2]
MTTAGAGLVGTLAEASMRDTRDGIVRRGVEQLDELCDQATVFSGQYVIGIEATPGVKGQKESEARVGLDDPGLSVDSATLVQPSLASLGDGLPGRAGSQRDEAKMQAPILPRT